MLVEEKYRQNWYEYTETSECVQTSELKLVRWRQQGVGITVSCYINVLIFLSFVLSCMYVHIYKFSQAYACTHVIVEQNLCSMYFSQSYHVSDYVFFFSISTKLLEG